ASAAAPLLPLDADLRVVFLFGLLQVLQRLLLGRQRGVRRGCLQLALGFLHRRDRLRQQIGHLLERRILLDEAAVHAGDEAVNLIPEPRLRQRDDDGVLAELVGRHLLAIALDVEGRGDDLTLLLRERADLILPAAAAPAAAAGIRLG